MKPLTRQQAVKIIATDMVKQNGGSITMKQAVAGLGPWYTDDQLRETAAKIGKG